MVPGFAPQVNPVTSASYTLCSQTHSTQPVQQQQACMRLAALGGDVMFSFPSIWALLNPLSFSCVNAPQRPGGEPRQCGRDEVRSGITCEDAACGRPADWPAELPYYLPIDLQVLHNLCASVHHPSCTPQHSAQSQKLTECECPIGGPASCATAYPKKAP
jgi:hypothetical protein